MHFLRAHAGLGELRPPRAFKPRSELCCRAAAFQRAAPCRDSAQSSQVNEREHDRQGEIL
jgi:hypothetical protein